VPAEPIVHRHAAGAAGAFVNAYLVETANGVVAVDGLLTVSDARALRSRLDALGKPLLALLVTHAHPDHYGGIGELLGSDNVPIVAAQGVSDIIRRDDELKEQILRPMFGDEWPRTRTFPNETARDGDRLDFDGARFTLVDLGPGESPHDSMWLLGDDERTAFVGDQAYNHMHCFLADGFYESWLANVERLRARFSEDAVFYVGHGEPATPALLDWQRGYIDAFVDAIRDVDWSDPERATGAVVERMKRYLASDDLDFLMVLSVEPMAAKLGVRSLAEA
jgi:glyoxylase-like metal-dependent hydrolase (beta-lactamase superfamily II)